MTGLSRPDHRKARRNVDLGSHVVRVDSCVAVSASRPQRRGERARRTILNHFLHISRQLPELRHRMHLILDQCSDPSILCLPELPRQGRLLLFIDRGPGVEGRHRAPLRGRTCLRRREEARLSSGRWQRCWRLVRRALCWRQRAQSRPSTRCWTSLTERSSLVLSAEHDRGRRGRGRDLLDLRTRRHRPSELFVVPLPRLWRPESASKGVEGVSKDRTTRSCSGKSRGALIEVISGGHPWESRQPFSAGCPFSALTHRATRLRRHQQWCTQPCPGGVRASYKPRWRRSAAPPTPTPSRKS